MHVKELTRGLRTALPWFMLQPEPEAYLHRPFLCFDLETTNIEKGSALVPENRVVCAAWYSSLASEHGVQFAFGDELHQDRLMADIETVLQAGGFLVGHNIKFDLQWMARGGLDLRHVLCYDTMIGEYVKAGNRRFKLNLDATNRRYGGSGKTRIANALISGGVCPSQIEPRIIQARVMKDVKDTLHVFYGQRRALERDGKLAVQWTRCLITPALADIETKGQALDADRVRAAHANTRRDLDAALLEFNQFTAQAVAKLPPEHPLFQLTGGGAVNPGSSDQMAYFLYDVLKFEELTRHGSRRPIRNAKSKRWPDGKPQTSTKVLDKLRARTQRQRDFLALRKRVGSLKAEIQKTLDFYLGVVNEYNGVWYASFNQTVTQTHRLSSSGRRLTFQTILDEKGKPKELGIQGQNQPRKFKRMTRAKRDGWLVGNHDGSQLEFRVATFLGDDEQGKHNIRNDVDQHILTASVLLGEEEEDVTKDQRQAAKSETFKPLYGGRYGTPEQERYYAWFREQFPQLAETQKAWTFEVLKTKELRLPWGMRFYWPHTRMSDDGYIDNTPSIYNYPIQSFATADIIPIALAYLWHRIAVNAPDIEIIGTVHDSVTAELPPELAGMWHALGVQCFTTDVYAYLRQVYKLEFDVPLGVGTTLGTHWDANKAEGGTEVEWNVEPDGTCWKKGTRANKGA